MSMLLKVLWGIVFALIVAIVGILGFINTHPWRYTCPNGMVYAYRAGLCVDKAAIPIITRD